MLNIKPKTPAQMADAYGKLLAEKAEMAKREKALKDAMLKAKLKEFNGSVFRVTVSVQTGRTSFDATRAKDLLTDAQVRYCTKPLADATRFNCNALVADTSVAA